MSDEQLDSIGVAIGLTLFAVGVLVLQLLGWLAPFLGFLSEKFNV